MGAILESFGRYKVIGPIGSGGMGEVYVARDPKLGRKVAIKMLPQRLISERDMLPRFTHEARSASALNHPNIVTIHEVDAFEGTPYIVMEYIEGEDLRTLVQSGPVPVRKVLDIAAQIADGLAAAHERGIVHRDLKPENVMVTRDGYVKILDFGLAKRVSPSPDGEDTQALEMPGTNPGTILGTVGYMSPEQATGRRLDFRSDQFALGAILYELATGTAAFDEDTAIDTLSAILHKDPPPITKANPRAPVQLADIISRLLEKSADDRYSSSRDLAREIRLLRERVVAEESGFHQSQPMPVLRRSVTAGVVAAVALAVVLIGIFIATRDRWQSLSAKAPLTAPATKKYLAVMRFNDLTGDANGRLVVDGFGETLKARLAHYPTVQVMRAPTPDAESGVDARAVARNLGANLVLSGSMMRDKDRIRVTYSVLEPSTGKEWRELVEGNISDLFAVQDDVAESVADHLALGPATVKVALDPAVSQRRYLEALGHMRRYDKEESLDSAIRILKELGDSPSVQAALARAYLGKFQITQDPDLANAANSAAEKALKGDPQSMDVNITLGELRRQTGRYPEAIAVFVRVLSQQPGNVDAVLGLAETYRAAGDFRNAEASYARAIGLQPNSWSAYSKLGFFYYVQGRYEKAIPEFQKVIQLVPDNERGYINLGGIYQRLGRYDDAVNVFQQSIRRAPSGQGYSNLGTSYYFLGRYSDAARSFEKAVALTPHDFLYWRNLGDAYRWIPGQEANARRAYQRAIALADEAIRLNPNNARAYLSRASALAKLGRVPEARTAIIRALELEPQYASNAYEAAVIANIAGAEDDAIARIEQALRLRYNVDNLMRDPEFANLKKSGRLQAIISGFRSSPK
jgi:Flp pilus assembly protein TadD/TolB-like protein/tRNA A-37 threonylcarbamoyl transferase component Bud32